MVWVFHFQKKSNSLYPTVCICCRVVRLIKHTVLKVKSNLRIRARFYTQHPRLFKKVRGIFLDIPIGYHKNISDLNCQTGQEIQTEQFRYFCTPRTIASHRHGSSANLILSYIILSFLRLMPHLQLDPSTIYYMSSRSKDNIKMNSIFKQIYLISVFFKGALTRRVFRASGTLRVVPRL
jgi:hypothetical protein